MGVKPPLETAHLRGRLIESVQAMDGKTLIERMLFLSGLLIAVPARRADDFQGRVVGVVDGDTIEVLHEKKTERVRLYGIDCAEKWQACGQKAKQASSCHVFGKDVKVETHGKDK